MLSEFFLKSKWIFVVVLRMLIFSKNYQVFKLWRSPCHFWIAILPARSLYSSSLKSTKPLSPKREWKSIRIYSDMVGYICSLSISCKHSIWSLYATEHINILYLSTNKSRYYRIPLGYLGWPLNNVNE